MASFPEVVLSVRFRWQQCITFQNSQRQLVPRLSSEIGRIISFQKYVGYKIEDWSNDKYLMTGTPLSPFLLKSVHYNGERQPGSRLVSSCREAASRDELPTNQRARTCYSVVQHANPIVATAVRNLRPACQRHIKQSRLKGMAMAPRPHLRLDYT